MKIIKTTVFLVCFLLTNTTLSISPLATALGVAAGAVVCHSGWRVQEQARQDTQLKINRAEFVRSQIPSAMLNSQTAVKGYGNKHLKTTLFYTDHIQHNMTVENNVEFPRHSAFLEYLRSLHKNNVSVGGPKIVILDLDETNVNLTKLHKYVPRVIDDLYAEKFAQHAMPVLTGLAAGMLTFGVTLLINRLHSGKKEATTSNVPKKA